MHAVVSLVAVLALCAAGLLGARVEGLNYFFAVVMPYAAIVLFLGGIIWRVAGWASSPVPFKITTTCGQERSLDWIKSSKLESPPTTFWVVVRMALEVLTFRSLFRNTRTELKEGGKVVYGPNKWLWLGAIAFHYSMLVILLRHLRFFTEPVPRPIMWLTTLDGFFQVGLPHVYVTTIIFLAALTFLFLRRAGDPQIRYISLASDYFPLFLLLGIGTTGLLLRHFFKTDIISVKEMAMSILSFKPTVPKGIHPLFYAHFFMVCVLFAYFPFSKLCHMAGVFLSPTRNMANDNRMNRHVNPWAKDLEKVKTHSYEAYENEFRDKMKAAGIPVDKE